MRTFTLMIIFMVLATFLFGQDKKEHDYSKRFIKDAVPGSYEELSLPKEKLLGLKRFEPFTKEKVTALIRLNILSKTQGKLIKTKLDKDGIINLVSFDKKLKEANVPLELILKLVQNYDGPYTKEVLQSLKNLNILTKDEISKLGSFLTQKGTIPGIPQEEMIISVLDNWNGVPLNSFGMIDTDQLLMKWEMDKKLKKFYVLVQTHQELMADLASATDPRSYKIRDIKKLNKKRNKKIKTYMKKAVPLEQKIALEKNLMSYLYLAGVYQIRYSSKLMAIQDLDRDAGNLILSLLVKLDKKNRKSSIVSSSSYHLTGLEKFICIDKSLLWLVNRTTAEHKEMAKRVLKGLLNNSGHPPWEAPYTMWGKWWKVKQKEIYTATVLDLKNK